MMKRRRLLITGVLLLLLGGGGAIVNVAVAWGCAITLPLYGTEPIRGKRWDRDGRSWELQKWRSAGGVALYSARLYVPGTTLSGFGPDPDAFVPFWASLCEPTARFQKKPASGVEVREADARGWPMIAMWSEIEWHVGPSMEIRGGIQTNLSPWPRGGARIPKVLPLRPIWPGFAVNTIFYAAMLWVMWFVPGMVRRRIRHRRGLCPACAYPIGTSPVCTECGNPLKIRTCMGLPPPATPATDTERTT